MKWTRIERPIPVPSVIREALASLDAAGFVGFLVGGCVRDFLLQRPTKDFDIATNATPDEIEKIFPGSLTVGKQFGVIKVPASDGSIVEIATFREDLEYKDGRHPVGVKFAGPEEDARRRDFTVNALFYDPKTQRILDTFDGLADLQARRIRAIGTPTARFKEDALRLLRAIRFATTLGFEIDPATLEAIRTQARLITRVSGERIREELGRMLRGPKPATALALLSDCELLPWILPELEALKRVQQPSYVQRNLWLHTLKVVETCTLQNPERSEALAWASVFQEIGKPIAWKKSGEKSFAGHDREAAAAVEKIAARLKFSVDTASAVSTLVRDHLRLREVFNMREATLQRLIRSPLFPDLLALHRAAATVTDGNQACWEFARTRHQEFLNSPPVDLSQILKGEDLIALGLKPGPKFSEILGAVEDQVLERRIQTKEQALEFVLKLI